MSILRQIVSPWICCPLMFSLGLLNLMPITLIAAPQYEALAPLSSDPSPEQLRDLVAPIALYPDALVAQILTAAEYPDQIAEAERFIEANPQLTGEALAAEVDRQDWDPSVKALTQFSSVLANMAKNLAWTSALGDAYLNHPSEVMDAIQDLRRRAKKAGTLKSNSQIKVKTEGDTIVIEPANPEVVYVPVYDPAVVFGYPVELWPGFVPWWSPGVGISFSVGFAVGPFVSFAWGWPAWAFDWRRRVVLFARAPYVVGRPVFYHRGTFVRPVRVYPRGALFVRGYVPRVRYAVGRPLVVRPAVVARGHATRGRASLRR